MSRRTAVGIVASVCVAFAARGAAAGDLDLPAQERVLDNGMKLVVLEDRSIPNCALYVWWKVGSRDERLGATGVAHFFEHMMFRGGARYGKTFDVVMERAGGSNNAFTMRDVTVYQDWFPKEALPLILDMEKDRMSGMVFDEKTVLAERDVVASEWRAAYEQPEELADEQLWATAYAQHPYRWSVLGWWNDVMNWKQADLEEFFDRNYAPNNATVVLVGDVDAAGALDAMSAAFAPIPRKPDRAPLHSQEDPQRGERRSTIESDLAPAPQVRAAWHICRPTDPDFPALDVLEAVLLHGASSRLHRLLVEDLQLCQSVTGGWQGYGFDPGLFTVDSVLRAGGDPAKVEEVVYAELERLAKAGPSEREMTKAKNDLEAAFVRRLKTINDKAHLLGETETFFGGWRNLPKRVERIRAVTADDVKRVLGTYFKRTNRTVVTLVPVPGPAAGDADPGTGGGAPAEEGR